MAQASSDKSWLEEFVEGARVLLVVDTLTQGELELRDIRRVLDERPDIEIEHDRKHSIHLANGGWIRFITVGQAGHSSRGTQIDRLVQLQTHPLSQRAWGALAPCLTRTI